MCKILVDAQNCEIVPRQSHLKVPGGLKIQQTLADWPFSLVLSV